MLKSKLKLGDNVKVITGKSKGHIGRIISMIPNKGVALVEGANIISRHTKPNAQSPDGGIIKKEAPINLSNLMLVENKKDKSKTKKEINKKRN